MDDNGIQPDCFTAARRWSSNASVIRGSQPKTSLSGIFLRSTLLFIAFANIIPWDFHLSTRSKKCIENFYQNLFVLTTAFFIFFTASARTWIVWINFLFYVDCTCVVNTLMPYFSASSFTVPFTSSSGFSSSFS